MSNSIASACDFPVGKTVLVRSVVIIYLASCLALVTLAHRCSCTWVAITIAMNLGQSAPWATIL